jgi:glycosyltransferase involved in cell wall biosynthesis
MGVTADAAADEIVYIGYTGGLGGEAIHMFDLAAAVAALGRRVTVVVPELDALRPLLDRYHGITNLTLVTTPLIRFDTRAQDPRDVLRLLSAYRSADVLHLQTGDICLPRMTLLALELLRHRNLYATIHCPHPEMPYGSLRARYWASAVDRRFRCVICPSCHGRQAQIGYGLPPQKAVTIHNGVDVARFAAGEGGRPRGELGLDARTPLVVYAARLYPQKRPLDALSVFAAVAGARPDVHLALVGAGPLESEVRAALRLLPEGIRRRVHLPGRRDDISDWLAAATVWLFPTEAENFSLSVIEALAAGCPVVSTNCHGNDEILVDGENALIAGVGDVVVMAEAVARLLSDTALRERLRVGGRLTAAGFTRERMAECHLACYAGMLPRLAVRPKEVTA